MYADSGATAEIDDHGNPRRMRRRRRKTSEPEEKPHAPSAAASESEENTTLGEKAEEEALSRKTRECPVPKPGGLIGQILGFRESLTTGAEARSSTPRTVAVEERRNS
jgi:cytochrome c oxidase assembly factor 2